MKVNMKNNVSQGWVNDISGNQEPLFFILGPCVMENEADTMRAAEFLKKLSEKLNFKLIFKGSFDKANRTALQGFRGTGIGQGLAILERVKKTFEVPVITDIHETVHVNEVADVVDVLQIPAFLCRQTDLLIAAGKTGKPVHVKKGQFETPESMQHVTGKIESTGNRNIWLCERGYSFGYNNLVVDYRNFSIMKSLNKPVVFDVTHSVQRPGGLGCASGGDSAFIMNLAASAIVQGIAGLFLMVHHEPSKARCCGPVSVDFNRLESVLTYLMELDAWTKRRVLPAIQ
jgi:2-dehydro-3-deoxyphosphooctonate aldolase (KDO 8-P synthase)